MLIALPSKSLMAALMPSYGAMGAAAAMVGFALVRQILLSRAAKAHLVEG